jgi:alpha-L-fucosidase
MKGLRPFLYTAALIATFSLPHALAPNFTEIRPSPQQLEWQDLQFGVIILGRDPVHEKG